jgi:MFS family permease
MTAAYVGLLLTSALPLLFALAGCFAVGSGAIQVVSQPFMAEHSNPHERNNLFAIQFAIGNATSVVAAVAGGFIAQQVAASAGFDPQGPEAYRVLIAIMAVLGFAALALLTRLTDDRPGRRATRESAAAEVSAAADGRGLSGGCPEARVAGLPGAGRIDLARTIRTRVTDPADFARLLLPGFLIAIGAGQVIPYLNMFVERRFELQLASLNLLFAVTSLGTLVATLVQPALARRFGKIGSVVLVQGVSIPFIVVLGFSPVFWTVALAMMVRNSLMNAGNPIFGAFAMEHVRTGERATFSAASNLLWSLGWVIGGIWYSLLQAALGFFGGYTVNFLTIIALYSVGTALYWVWFGRDERKARGRRLSSRARARADPAGGRRCGADLP